MASFLGTGTLADIFFVAFRFPNTFRRIFSEGAFNSAFVPVYTKLIQGDSFKDAQIFSGNIFLIFLIFTSLLVIIIEIFMPFFIFLIAPGFSSDAEKFSELVKVARIIFPFLILLSVSSIYSSILNSNNQFALTAALPIILNIVLIISLMISYFTSSSFLIFLSWSVIIAGIIQVALLFFSLKILNLHIIYTLKIFASGVGRFFRLFSVSFFSSGLLQINILIGTIIASYESGAISYLYYADRVYQLPLALIGIAIGITLLPSISSKIRSETSASIHFSIEQTLIFALLFSLPACIGIFMLSELIVSVLFERGEFDNNSSYLTAKALQYYCLGLVAFILMKIYTPIFFAYENARPTIVVTLVNLILNTLLSIILFLKFGFIGIAIATSISAWMSILIMHYYLNKYNYFKLRLNILYPIIIISIVSFIMYLYLSNLLRYSVNIVNFLFINEIIFLLFSVLSSILLYFILISFYKPFNYTEIKKILQK